MTPLFPAQRAAEEFDRVLSGSAPPAAIDRYADLLDMVTTLRRQPEVLPRAEFVGDLRSRLMTAAEAELVTAPAVVRHLTPVRTPHTRRRIGTVAASLVIVGGTAGMAAAASGALPGDGLYPIKRGVEHAETAVRVGDASKGQAMLGQAVTRLDEVRSLQGEGSPDSAVIDRTVDSFQSSAEAGSARLFKAYRAHGDANDITTVRTFTARQMLVIASLSGTSATTDAALVDAADALTDIDQRARELCTTCGPAKPVTPPAALSAGAGAATVDNLLARPVVQATADIKRNEKAHEDALKSLGHAAEKSAGKLSASDGLGTTGVTSAAAGAPVTSTLTPDGTLTPGLDAGHAAKGLVSGVTQSLQDLTGQVTGGKTPLDGAVKGLKDTVDGVAGGLTDGLSQAGTPSPKN